MTNDEGEINLRSACRVWDAEADTMDTVGRYKEEAPAQSMQVELHRQSRFPSFGMPAIPWFPFYSGPAPSAPPRMMEPDQYDEPATGGSS